MKHVVLYSGGIGSWATAHRIVPDSGDELILLFTDTKTEDEDLYRFLRESVEDLDGELVWLEDGRDVWEVFNDENFIGNTRVDICSRILKRDLSRKWIKENCDPADTIVYLGVDWTEVHRYERAKPRWEPYVLAAPLCDPPYIDKADMIAMCKDAGIRPPRLYEMGAAHNNCGGFCVKAGHGQFRWLLEQMPERYAYHEQKERDFRERVGKDVAIMKDRRGGTTRPLTMEEFRLRIEAENTEELELDEFGGCGCMVDFDDDSEIGRGREE